MNGKKQTPHETIPDDPEVLIVDDEEEVAELHTYRIEDKYRGIPAYSGEEAIKRISVNTDVVLLDRRMPKYSGDDVLEDIREIGYAVQVIMVTAVDPEKDISNMDFDGYITKPVGAETLKKEIDTHMKIKRYNQIRREILSAESRLEILNNEVDLDDEEEQEKTEVKQKISKLENIQEQIRGALDIDI